MTTPHQTSAGHQSHGKAVAVDAAFLALAHNGGHPAPGPEWRTRAQLQAVWGRSQSAARIRLTRLVKAGKLERAMFHIVREDGQMMPAPHYRVREGK